MAKLKFTLPNEPSEKKSTRLIENKLKRKYHYALGLAVVEALIIISFLFLKK